jgi:hypothetical protein
MSDGHQQNTHLKSILVKAKNEALAGGIPGMVAMSAQVVSLMWLRTTVNYQYRYGTSTATAFKTLYKDGGIARFYRGIGPALIQGPLSRFGDTAANSGMLSLLESFESTRDLPLGIKTVASSLSAASFRIVLMPIDTLKTTLQVEGGQGWSVLTQKLRTQGVPALYHGSLAASAATFAGHYPWFFTYNYLSAHIPECKDSMSKKLLRSAFIGFCASFVSDCCANSLRVIKTTRQTSKDPIAYNVVVRSILMKDGVMGLLGRGLMTKIITNGLQGLMFSVAWKLAQEQYKAKST